eukprot:jgi/Botrbrau1/5074/Bobra.37_1s0038.1
MAASPPSQHQAPGLVVSTLMACNFSPLTFSAKSVMRPVSSIFITPERFRLLFVRWQSRDCDIRICLPMLSNEVFVVHAVQMVPYTPQLPVVHVGHMVILHTKTGLSFMRNTWSPTHHSCDQLFMWDTWSPTHHTCVFVHVGHMVPLHPHLPVFHAVQMVPYTPQLPLLMRDRWSPRYRKCPLPHPEHMAPYKHQTCHQLFMRYTWSPTHHTCVVYGSNRWSPTHREGLVFITDKWSPTKRTSLSCIHTAPVAMVPNKTHNPCPGRPLLAQLPCCSPITNGPPCTPPSPHLADVASFDRLYTKAFRSYMTGPKKFLLPLRHPTCSGSTKGSSN